MYPLSIGLSNDENLVEETEDLASNLLATGLVVAHDALGGGEHNMAELTGWQKIGDPLLGIPSSEIKARRDDTTLVDPAPHHRRRGQPVPLQGGARRQGQEREVRLPGS